MKLLRRRVALLLASSLPVATSHRGAARHGPASLLQVEREEQAPVPSMRDTSDALGGILDAITTSFAQIRSELGAVGASCKAEIGAAAARVQSQSSAISGLFATKLENLAKESGLQAELDHLLSTEGKTRASYDSTVSRRAQEAQSFTDWQSTSTKQRTVLTNVLDTLRQKRAIAVAVGSGNSSGNVTMPPSSQSSQLDYVIGTFSNLLSTVTQTESKEVAEQAQQDSQLQNLAVSYTDSLQRLDAQYEAKLVEKAAARSAASAAAADADDRAEIVRREEASLASLRQLCGATGGSGEVQRVITIHEQAVDSLKRNVEQVLLTMEGLMTWAATTTTTTTTVAAPPSGAFLQMTSSHRRSAEASAPQAAVPPLQPMSPVQTSAVVSMPPRAARWVAEARASGLAPLPPAQPPKRAQVAALRIHAPEDGSAATLEAAAESLADRRLTKALESLPLAALLRTRRVLSDNSTGALSAASQDCVQQKQRLQADFVVSRQAERALRESVTELNATIANYQTREAMTQQEETMVTGSQALLDNAFVAPTHLQMGGNVTHTSASDACRAQGGRLCLASEICPRGDVHLGPLGAALAGQHWAPVDDFFDEWVHIGSLDFGTCLISSSLASPPAWMSSNAADAAKDHVFCCGAQEPLVSFGVDSRGGMMGVIRDASSELLTVRANVTAFLALGSPPLAGGLEQSLSSVGSSLYLIQNSFTRGRHDLVALYGGLQNQYADTAGMLHFKRSSLVDLHRQAADNLTATQAQLQVQEEMQRNLTAQQALLQARCEAVLNGTAA